MATAFQHQLYELRFGAGETAVQFHARGIVQALVRAGRMMAPGCTATLLEDGVPIGTLSPEGRLIIAKRPGTRRELAGKSRSPRDRFH